MKTRLCVICGARVRNQNPKTTTCCPDCTAVKNGKPPTEEPEINICKYCGIAIDDDLWHCNACADTSIEYFNR